ncbi:MAG: family 16 glycosylhydrolase [Flavobacterium sp.]|nr:family 16 glycosylhydrolase [Flavobacterium sp.]
MKIIQRIPKLLWVLAVSVYACSKGNSGTTVNNEPPSNLIVKAVVNTDNSGNVAFTATATNAVTFDFDYGNGVFATVPSGSVTYKYPSSGTYTINVIAKSSGGKTISQSVTLTVTVTLALIFSDEFETTGTPDASKWGYDIGIGPGNDGWGNNELQYYTSSSTNASVSNGTLKITAVKESYSGRAYTSARLLSQNKFSFKYGKVEVRAKLPAGVGTWPAIWMLGNNISSVSWPACGEIDIMEHKGSELNKIHGTFHYPGRSGGNADGNTVTIANASTEFHIYSAEWSASSIKLFVDGQLIHTLNNSSSLPFNQNFFIILNLAMGGNFGGTVDAAFSSATMEIDYVRVYQ